MAEVYVAVEAFRAESDIELSLNPGDRITVSSHDDDGKWSYGNIGTRFGWFPADHARPETNRPSSVSSLPASSPGPPVPIKPSPTRNNSNVQQRAQMLQGIFGPSSTPQNNLHQQQQNISSYQDDSPRSSRSPNGYQSSNNFTQPSHTQTPVNQHYPSNNHVRHSYDDHQPMFRGNSQPRDQYPRRTSASALPQFNPTPSLQRSAPPALPHSSSFSGISSPNHNSRPINPYTFQFCVETLHPYTKQNNEELSFSPREKLDIIEKPSPSDEWWRARNKSGEMGLIPKTYVKEKHQPLPVLADRLWYKYKIKREETEDRMRNKDVECYVIRDSEAFPGCFTLSVKGPDKVRHIKITTTSSGYEVGDKKFHSLDAVVDFYRNSPIFIANNGAYQLFLSKPLT